MATTEVRARGPYPTPYPAPADPPMDYKMYIGGEWVESESGERFDVYSPGDGSLIGSVPKGTAADVQTAIAGARKAQKEMAKLSIPARAKLLFKASEIAYRRLEHDARVLCRECGKTITEARDEIEHYSAPHFIEAAEGIKRYRGRVNPSIQEDTLNKRILVIHQPMGVIGIISPWNWPHDIPNIAATHALAAGNAVIFKPASTTPYSALMLAEIFEEAGFPAGAVNVVTGPGGVVGEELVSNPGTNAIHFTGETVTGERLTRIAGIKTLMLELGRQRSSRGHGRRQHRGGRGSHDHRLLLSGRPGVHGLRAHPGARGDPRRVRRDAGQASRPGQGRESARRGHRHGSAQQPLERRQGAVALRRRARARRIVPHGRHHRRACTRR